MSVKTLWAMMLQEFSEMAGDRYAMPWKLR